MKRAITKVGSPPARADGECVFSIRLASLGRTDLDETRELELAVGELLRPEVDLLAVLPLQQQSGDRAFADLQRMRVGRILALELDAADGAFPVGRLERGHELVRIG